ncbi:hypothetical protein [Fodinicola feengrottensis]|nr:hypothetical protein [Fodinicola feengrottensis]
MSNTNETTDMATKTSRLLRRGFALEWATLGWNVVGIVVLAAAAVAARSVALAGFGLDSLIEIGASIAVIWELSDTGGARRARALRLIGIAFAALAGYLVLQSTVALIAGLRPDRSPAGIADGDHRAGDVFPRCRQSAYRRCPGQPGPAHRGTSHHHRRHSRRRGAGRPRPQQRSRLVVGRSAGRLHLGPLRHSGNSSIAKGGSHAGVGIEVTERESGRLPRVQQCSHIQLMAADRWLKWQLSDG